MCVCICYQATHNISHISWQICQLPATWMTFSIQQTMDNNNNNKDNDDNNLRFQFMKCTIVVCCLRSIVNNNNNNRSNNNSNYSSESIILISLKYIFCCTSGLIKDLYESHLERHKYTYTYTPKRYVCLLKLWVRLIDFVDIQFCYQ